MKSIIRSDGKGIAKRIRSASCIDSWRLICGLLIARLKPLTRSKSLDKKASTDQFDNGSHRHTESSTHCDVA